MAGRTFVLLEHPIRTHTISTTTRPYSTHKHQTQMAGWLALAISNTSGVNLHRQGMAGRWLGGFSLRFPKHAGVITNRCNMAEG